MELFGRHYHQPGTMPGTLPVADAGQFLLTLVSYNASGYQEEFPLSLADCKAYIGQDEITWIHIQGEASSQALEQLDEIFGLHRLHLEDSANYDQRPKLDVIDQQAFVLLSLPVFQNNNVTVSQLSIFLSDHFVISMCAGVSNPFDVVYDRIRHASGKLRSRSIDYLFYTLIDTVIDYGFPVLEYYADVIEQIEERLIDQPGSDVLQDIHKTRRELLLLRRRLWPHREIVSELLRDEEYEIIRRETRIYLRDCYDHTISIFELLETYREMTSSMLEVYLSSMSHKLNEVMKVLTVIATLFIPPTFIVSLYGMNFDRSVSIFNMPELEWRYGYLFAWLIILGMFIGMLMYFKRRRWF